MNFVSIIGSYIYSDLFDGDGFESCIWRVSLCRITLMELTIQVNGHEKPNTQRWSKKHQFLEVQHGTAAKWQSKR